MRVRELIPGMLLEPVEGCAWYEIPWRGAGGKIVGYYLHVEAENSTKMMTMTDKPARREAVLYLGTADESTPKVTPGRQRVLAWGETLTVEPLSWKWIQVQTTN